jgi:acetyl esterase/lipase
VLDHLSPQARAALLRGPVRPKYPPRGDHAAWLALVERTDAALGAALPALDDLPASVSRVDVDGVPAVCARPDGLGPSGGPPADAVYLDIHGGGFIYCGGELCARITARTAVTTGLVTWGVDYRMPPSHPFPAAVEDCLTVYRHVCGPSGSGRVVVGGVSAGGNLAAATLLRAREEGLPMPAGLVLLSPEVDLTESGDSFVTNAAHDNVLSSLRPVNELYAAGHDLAQPHLSPLFGDLSGFPPTLLQSGTRDLLLSNTVRMHRALLAAGAAAELHVFEAMPHGGFGPSPEGDDLATTINQFVRRVVAD